MKKNNVTSEVVMEYKSPFAMPALNINDDEYDEEGFQGDDRQDDEDEEELESVQGDRSDDDRGYERDDSTDGEESEDDEENEKEDESESSEGESETSGDDGDDDEKQQDLYGGIAQLLIQDGFLENGVLLLNLYQLLHGWLVQPVR